MARGVLPPFRKELSKDKTVTRLGEETAQLSRLLRTKSLLQGRLIKSQEITSSGVEIAHTLDRQWQGWLIVDKDGGGDIYRTSSSDETKYLKLQTVSGTVTASVWVF